MDPSNKVKDFADKVEDKDDIPNSDRDSPNIDAKTPNMEKTTTGLDTPKTDRNIPNMDRDIYMGSRVGKDSNHDRGNNDMRKDAHNLGKKASVPELDWMPSMQLKA